MIPAAKAKPEGSIPAASVARLSLRTNFSWTFVGNVLYAASQWGMLVALSKLGSAEMVGQFALALAVTAPIFMFANMNLRTVQATDARGEYLYNDYLSLRILTMLIAIAISAGIAVLSDYRAATAWAIIVMGVAKGFDGLGDVTYGLFQQRERMDRIAKSLILKGPLSLVALAVGVLVTDSVIGGVLGMTAVWAVILVIYDLRNAAVILHSSQEDAGAPPDAQGVLPRWSLSTSLKLTWLALPLGFTAMLVSLYVNIPRYFLENEYGEASLGIFAAIAYLMVAGNVVVLALGQATSPRLAQYFSNDQRRAFVKLLAKLLGIGLFLGGSAFLVALIAGRTVLTLIYKPEYAEHVNIFVWLMGVAAVHYMSSLLSFAIAAARYFKIQFPLLVVVTLVTLGLSAWLVPYHGMNGAAIALMGGNLTQFTGSALVILYALRQPLINDRAEIKP